MWDRFRSLVFMSLVATAAKASFFPPNSLHLEQTYGSSSITEARFKEIIDEVVLVYRPIVESHGATLKVNYLWSDTTVNASAEQDGTTWIVNMYGGLARRPEITDDGFSAVVCHELGHHLGGFFYYGDNDWASSEGQADYFATHSCLREVWKNSDSINSGYKTRLSALGVAGCDRAWQGQADRNLCYRIAASGESLAKLLAALGRGKVPRIETPDRTEVTQSSASHPQAQCRLDTYFSGSICPVNFDPMIIPGRYSTKGQNSVATEKETIGSYCHSALGFLEGNRPRCWFKPNVNFLLITKANNKAMEASGNGNGIIEPGESISVVPTFKNETVDKTVSSMKATLKSTNPALILKTDSIMLPGMDPGASSTPTQGFAAKIAEGTTCGSTIDYQISVESPEGNTSISDSLFVGKIEALEGGLITSGEAIPDANPTGISSTISLDSDMLVSTAKVKLDVTHNYTADITIDIVSPSGKTTRLYNRRAGRDIRLEVTLPVEGSIKGDWKLVVVDNAKRDQGILNSWGIEFEHYKCEM